MMQGFKKKTLGVSRGLTYTYYILDGDRSLPPLFFQHGWPDHAQMWEGIANALKTSGSKHPIIIPDMLGYGGTSKPTDPAAYQWNLMMKDLIEIIDAEDYERVISAGHDWGALAAARLYNYYPDRVAGMFLMNVPYTPPTRGPFDLDAFNQMTIQFFGYPAYAYWYLFTAPDAPDLLRSQVGRLFSALHAEGSEAMKDLFCTPDAFRNYLEGTGEPDVRPYAKDGKLKQDFIERINRDGLEGAQCWYRATRDGFQQKSDAALPEERDKVAVPLLYVGCKRDAVCRPEGMILAKQNGLLPDIEETPMLDCAHWSPYEMPNEAAGYLGDWLKRKFDSRAQI